MRKLLILVFISLVAGLPTGTTQGAYPYLNFMGIYHPTGSGTSATSQLHCGWHFNCNNVPGDAPPLGLDWTWTNGNHYSRFRVKVLSGDRISQYLAAKANAIYVGPPFACQHVEIGLFRLYDYALYGTVHDGHTSGGWSGYLDIYGGPGVFVQTDVYVGPMVDPAIDDCNSPDTNWHVMQTYVSGPADYSVEQSPYIPNEGVCDTAHPNGCPAYAPWTTYEEKVLFYSYN